MQARTLSMDSQVAHCDGQRLLYRCLNNENFRHVTHCDMREGTQEETIWRIQQQDDHIH